MERMSTLDAGFYLVDHRNVPMHLGSVAIFDGPAPPLAELTGLYAGRLARMPRYRQVVRTVSLQLLRPAWADDPDFDIRDQIRHIRVPRPGSDAQLRELAEQIFAEPLDLHKPLWEAWLLDGLADGRWAVLSKVHHCVVDGIGGSDLMTMLFGPEPDFADQSARSADGADGVAGAIARPVRELAAVAGSVLTQLPGVPDVAAYGQGLARGARRLAAASVGSLNGPAGRSRRWAWTSANLDDLRTIRSKLGGTVNDVLLAAAAGSLRRVIPERELAGDQVVRSLVPVSIRAATESGAVTNRLSAVLINLPVAEQDPLRRLELVHAQTEDLKRTHQAAGPVLLSGLLGPVAPPLLALGLRTAFRLPQPLVQTVTTNVRGPAAALSALGHPLAAIYPYAPIGGNVRISFAMYSYAGMLYFGVTADCAASARPEELTSGLDCEIAIFSRLAGLDREPVLAPAASAPG
jgi:diacylglycerol O-acyltransferase / wax synthase